MVPYPLPSGQGNVAMCRLALISPGPQLPPPPLPWHPSSYPATYPPPVVQTVPPPEQLVYPPKSHKLDQKKKELETLMVSSGNKLKNSESDYVFISFILDYLPVGFVGLLIAVILSAAMSSTSAEITALSSISTIDFYKRLINSDAKEVHYIKYSKLFTLLWGF